VSQIEVVHGGKRVSALRVDRPPSARLHSWPRDGEPVGVEPQLGHDVKVGLEAVVVIISDIAGVTVPGCARGVAEGVPNGFGAAACFLRE
jgi:hypothetical protein